MCGPWQAAEADDEDKAVHGKDAEVEDEEEDEEEAEEDDEGAPPFPPDLFSLASLVLEAAPLCCSLSGPHDNRHVGK